MNWQPSNRRYPLLLSTLCFSTYSICFLDLKDPRSLFSLHLSCCMLIAVMHSQKINFQSNRVAGNDDVCPCFPRFAFLICLCIRAVVRFFLLLLLLCFALHVDVTLDSQTIKAHSASTQ